MFHENIYEDYSVKSSFSLENDLILVYSSLGDS